MSTASWRPSTARRRARSGAGIRFRVHMVRALALAVAALAASAASAAATPCPTDWRLVGTDTFHYQDTLMRSQGVATDGQSWFFSWQGGLSHTLDDYTPIGVATLPL